MNKKLITEVVQGMLGTLNNVQLDKLQHVMEHALYGKEVIEKQMEDIEKSNEQLLQSFLAAKRIEGCSEKSLTYYKATIETMLENVDKIGRAHV